MKQNRVPACQGCRYNTSHKDKGGMGKIYNGETMKRSHRCPEWTINLYMQEAQLEVLSIHTMWCSISK